VAAGKWRALARKVIARALADAAAQAVPRRGLRKFLAARYGEYYDARKKYQYRVWREEVAAALERARLQQSQTLLPWAALLEN